jgi:hypothetical protein
VIKVIYYIRKGQSSYFSKIKIFQNECEISQDIFNIKKTEKIVKKIKKKKIEQVVLSKEVKQNVELIKQLENYDITILDGKWLMQYMIEDIINYLEKNRKIEKIDEITILVNDLTEDVMQNIKKFANTFKKIRIVTNHLEKFKKIEKELYEKKGISTIITSNKRKAMSKSILIVNFDFVQEAINQYNVNENAIIINLSDKIGIDKKRFSGLIVTDYEVEFQNIDTEFQQEFLKLEDILKKQEEFSLKEILEEKIYLNSLKYPNFNLFLTVENIIKSYNITIKELYGVNGIIV